LVDLGSDSTQKNIYFIGPNAFRYNGDDLPDSTYEIVIDTIMTTPKAVSTLPRIMIIR